MSVTWGEAAWTARDLDVAYLVVDNDGEVYGGEHATEDDAIATREERIAVGVECWVIQIQRGSLVMEEFTC